MSRPTCSRSLCLPESRRHFCASATRGCVGARLAEEDLLELHHPGVGEQQGRIALGNDRRALHDAWPRAAKNSRKPARISLPLGTCALVVLSENLAHDVGGMAPADQESERSCPFGPRFRPLVPEAPDERGAPQRNLASMVQHPRDRTSDDGIGEAPASQFVGDLRDDQLPRRSRSSSARRSASATSST